MVYSEASSKLNLNEDEDKTTGNIIDFLLPMVVMVALAFITSDLVFAVLVSIAVCFVLYVPRKVVKAGEFFPLVIAGLADMLPTIAVVLCSFIWERLLGTMGIADFVIDTVYPLLVNYSGFFAAIAFVV